MENIMEILGAAKNAAILGHAVRAGTISKRRRSATPNTASRVAAEPASTARRNL